MALITSAEWSRILTAARVVDLCDDDSNGTADADVVSDVLEQASDLVQEYARRAGVTLTAPCTASMARRVAMIAAHYAAQRRPQYRDTTGRAPYAQEYDTAVKELTAWASRVHQSSDAEESTAPEPLGDDLRGW